jgi:hypothetical protein
VPANDSRPKDKVVIKKVKIESDFKPVSVAKSKELSEAEIEKMTSGIVNGLLTKIGESQKLGKITSTKFAMGRSRGGLVQAVYQVSFANKSNAQTMIQGTSDNEKFQLKAFGFELQ